MLANLFRGNCFRLSCVFGVRCRNARVSVFSDMPMLKLTGIIPPVVTPLIHHDQLDVVAVDRVCRHIIAGGVSGLFVLGTTGEGPSVTYQIRYEMVERACECAAGDVPVLVGITDSSFAESVHLAQHAATCGATAVVAAAPFYFSVTQVELLAWFTKIADESPLPLMLYNMPGCVGVNLDISTVVTLAKHPNIIGVKDSSGDLPYFGRLCREFASDEGFAVFMGPEELIPQAVAAGADGGVCGGANLLPHVYVKLFDAARQGGEDVQHDQASIVETVFESVYRDPDGQMNLIPALKLAMSLCGLCSAATAPPLPPLAAKHELQVKSRLAELLQSAGSQLVTSSIASS